MTPSPESSSSSSSSEGAPTSSEGGAVVETPARVERADLEHLKAWLQAWARAHGEEYRYLFGPAAFDRLASDLGQEFLITRKPRSTT
jgi:hypothetical protein